MLTPLNSRAEEDSSKTTGEYYYSSSSSHQQHYYCQIPFNYDSNQFYHPSLYDNNQYYTSLPNYSHGQEETSNIVYPTTYHSPESQSNEMFYPARPVDPQITPYPSNTDYVSNGNHR